MTYRVWILSAVCIFRGLYASSSFTDEYLWPLIQPLEIDATLNSLVLTRKEEIFALKDLWKPFALEEESRHEKFFADFKRLYTEGPLLFLESEGSGAAYVLYDKEEKPAFIIKPVDENIFCLNNPKHFASPFIDRMHRVKPNIPLYRAAQTEAFCYELAYLCNLEHVTPEAVLTLLTSPFFFHLTDQMPSLGEEEKLCSVQKYLEGSSSLKTTLKHLFALGLSEEDLLDRFDLEDFEDLQLFLWLTFDNDAHPENFRTYPKKTNAKGDIVYGLKKIDNSLTFPEANTGFFNTLMYFPHALTKISPRICSLIQKIPIELIKESMEKFGLSSSFFAFLERIQILQELIKSPSITYYECNLRLALLEKEQGVELALSNVSIRQLERLVADILHINSVLFLDL